MNRLTCFKCGTSMPCAGPDESVNQPSGGTAFYSYGHYGSTAFDPADGTRIEIAICDPCLVGARRDRVSLPSMPLVYPSRVRPTRKRRSA